jgi:hypothetical protein
MTTSGRAACAQCGISITSAIRGHKQYCSGACRTAAYRVRHALESRIWEGTTIQRRPIDGYVNATAMCQAGGKRWFDYVRLDRTEAYIAVLASALAGNPATENRCAAAVARNPATGSDGLIQTQQGGQPQLQGTWIHPRLAVDLARWISPAFAVWMDGWFLEWTQGRQPAAPAPAPRQIQQPLPIDWTRQADLLASMVRRCETGQDTAITPALVAEAAHQLAVHYRPIAVAAQLQPIAALMQEAATRLARVAV